MWWRNERSRDRGLRGRRQSGHALCLAHEPLEARHLLSVSALNDAVHPGKTIVSFGEDIVNAGDLLFLRLNASSELEFSLNGSPFSNDLSNAAGVQSRNIADISTIIAFLGGGADRLIIDNGAGQVVPQFGLTFVGEAGNNDQLEVQGSSGNDAYQVQSDRLVINGAICLFDTIESIVLDTKGGSDTIDVLATPPNVTTNIQDTNAAGSDIVTIGATSANFNTGVGTLADITGGVSISDVSGAELRIDNSSSAVGRTLTFSGTGTANLISGIGPAGVQFTGGISTLRVAAGTGADVLNVGFAGGNVLKNASNLRYFGNGGGDTLNLTGGTVDQATYTAFAPIAGQHHGTVVLSGAAFGSTSTIEYSGLAPIVDLVAAASRTFNAPPGAQQIRLRDDGTLGNGRSMIDSNGTNAFEEITFTNPTTQLTINAGDGADQLFINALENNYTAATVVNGGSDADVFNVKPTTSYALTLGGDAPTTAPGDQLVVDLAGVTGANFPNSTSGTVTFTSHNSIAFTSIEQHPGIVVNPPGGDAFEPNNSIATATVLGSEPTAIVGGLSISPAADHDFFKYTAHDTGTLVVRAHFTNAAGNIDLFIRDGFGNQIAAATTAGDGESLLIPVVGQQNYFIDVAGATALVTNANYSLEVENFAAPVPTAVVLDPTTDSGRSNLDGVTFRTNAAVQIVADLGGLGVPVLTPAQVAAGNSGVAVEVFTGGVSRGFASAVAGSNNSVFGFTFGAGQLAEGLNLVKAAVRVIDGQRNALGAAAGAQGRTTFGNPLALVLDQTAPAAPINLDLLATSDTGSSNTDNRTTINAPAFSGSAEAGSLVRIRANGLPVGEAFAGPDASDGVLGNDLGVWEITVEPLGDGTFTITATAEDLAGNISGSSTALAPNLVIDTLNQGGKPQRPTLDLNDPFDTGISNQDNITRLVALNFRVTAEAGTSVVIKDGETVIDSFVMPAAPFTNRTIDFTALPAGLLADGTHLLSAEATDGAGNVSDQSEELVLVIDRTAPAAPAAPDLLASSDTGVSSTDNITNKMQPAVVGATDANARLRVFATPFGGVAGLVGIAQVGSDATNGPEADGIGAWEATLEPLADGTYTIAATLEDVAGNVSPMGASLTIVVDTEAPNAPALDLVAASDTGRSNTDNVTRDNTPTFTSTSHERSVTGDAAAAHRVIYRLYDRVIDGAGAATETLVINSLVTLGGPVTVGLFTDTLAALTDGVHHFKLEFEDVAGNLSADYFLDVLIDTAAPAAPTLAVDPATTDTGVPGQPGTGLDRITSSTTANFIGQAEANALVRLFGDGAPISVNTITVSDAPLGLTLANPINGDSAFPAGRWALRPTLDLNDAVQFPYDGRRQMGATAEDLAGNVSTPGFLDILVDTQGPRVNSIRAGGFPAYDLFQQKVTSGPTPAVTSLVVRFTDGPTRLDGGLNFVYPAVNVALASNPANYRLVGDHGGQIQITTVSVADNTVAGQAGDTTVTLRFAQALADDRYTLVLSDSLMDDAGNRLDGDTNAVQPGTPLLFPTGDGVTGGAMSARFTVDSRPELAVYSAGNISIDLNGNLLNDTHGIDNDFTNRDLQATLGFITDAVFAGKFASAFGVSNGFDKLGVYGFTGGAFRWLIDRNGDNVIQPGAGDINVVQPIAIDGLPLAGNFDGNAANGDEVGLFDGQTWYFDRNADYVINAADFALGGRITGTLRGIPLVGDFDGDRLDDLAVYDNTLNQFSFDLAANGLTGNLDVILGQPQQIHFSFGADGELDWPVAGDYDLDGVDDLVLFNPGRSTQPAMETAEWYFLISNGNVPGVPMRDPLPAAGTVNLLNHQWQHAPLGHDLFAQWGDEFAMPLFGNFDPPGAGSNALAASAQVAAQASYDPVTSTFDVPSPGGTGSTRFEYGPRNSNWKPLYGDWDGDGTVTVGFYDPSTSTWFLKNQLRQGLSDEVFSYGPANSHWQPLVGDWDGDGADGVGFYDPSTSTWFLKNAHEQGISDVTFRYGAVALGWQPLVGDWDGDGRDGVGFYDRANSNWFLKNAQSQGLSDQVFAYGPAHDAWSPLVGDWDGDGRDGVGFLDRQHAQYFYKNSPGAGMSDATAPRVASSPDWKLVTELLFALWTDQLD